MATNLNLWDDFDPDDPSWGVEDPLAAAKGCMLGWAIGAPMGLALGWGAVKLVVWLMS